MHIFPTQYSTLSSKALNVYLAKAYNLHETQCRLLIRNVSDTYILESRAAKYIFKIYRDAHRKKEEILGELELLNLLSEHGASVARPLTDVGGSQLQHFNAAEGMRYGVLFSWAEGRVVTDLNEMQLETLGYEMAVLHNISSGIELKHPRKEYNTDTTLVQPLSLIKPAFSGLEEEYAYLGRTVYEVTEQMQQIDLSAFSCGYCHFDFLPKNFHFTDSNKLTFFDFDFAGKGLLAYDIASFYVHYFLELTAGRITQDGINKAFCAFVRSYRKVRPLSDEEIKAIPYLGFAFWLFYLGFQYENYDDWSNLFFTPRFIKDRVALMRRWMELSPGLEF
ncbi:phosphotransferase [Chitinophagaceae bacterium MMS25-I14]